jgi:hypothetical protein
MERMLLLLKRSPEQETALLKLLDDQQDKSSPDFQQWLTPEQFGQQFGPADSDIHAVTSWLHAHGFEVGQVSKGRSLIEFSGTAAQVKDAFHTGINKCGERESALGQRERSRNTGVAGAGGGGSAFIAQFLHAAPAVDVPRKVRATVVPGRPPQATFPTASTGWRPQTMP